jgi:uncharacterized protein (TIGR02646 family)
MIRVDRASVPVPQALTAPAGSAVKERTENEKKAKAGKYHEMKFTAYKSPDVMIRLRALFRGKCAYCECRFEAQQPGDVEHFRPKSLVAVEGADGKVVVIKEVYFWLAAEWTNLLPSCADCNRPRKHELREGSGRRVMGKANWFPVHPERRRARTARSVAKEPYQLLDPCVDDPGAHLRFDTDGTIEPAGPDAAARRRGEMTIKYCALARLELTQERYKRGIEVEYAATNLLASIQANDSAAVVRHARFLATMLAPDAAYSAFARAVATHHLGPHMSLLGP